MEDKQNLLSDELVAKIEGGYNEIGDVSELPRMCPECGAGLDAIDVGSNNVHLVFCTICGWEDAYRVTNG